MALYGAGTYICDSQPTVSAAEAEEAQAEIVEEILSCFAGQWFYIVDRSSPSHAVLHPINGQRPLRSASMKPTRSNSSFASRCSFAGAKR